MTRVDLRGLTPEALVALWPDLGIDIALARRVVTRVVWEDRENLEGLRGMPRALASTLLARGSAGRLQVVERRASPVDHFVKYLFRSTDGQVFESVRIPLLRPRWSVCVSSQVGCALGCAFCQTGRLGLTRQLEAWEMVEQVLAVRREGPERPVTSVVFQGQGEPLQNYDAVIRAALILRDPSGLRIRGENITISTVGLLPAIERFTEEGHPFRLVLSLTSAFDVKRASLLPVARRFRVAELAGAARRLAERRGGPVHLAWVLMSGINTGEDEARELARIFAGVPLRLSVIDVNDRTGRFRRADDAERGAFFAALQRHRIPFARRYSGGADVEAACGMLASTRLGDPPQRRVSA